MTGRIGLAALCLLLAGCGAAAPPAPTATPAPILAPAPGAAPPRMSPVPELRGATPEQAADALAAIGLALGQRQSSCEAIGGTPAAQPGPVGSILCQSIPPDSMAPAGLRVDYVVYEADM
jgi:hypothetical protein